jgi:lipopolysaccharide transport system ATP-binding protein
MAAIESICSRAILISKGRVQKDDKISAVIQEYFGSSVAENQNATVDLRAHPNRWPGRSPMFTSLTMRNARGEATTSFYPGSDLILQFRLEPTRAISQPTLGIGVDNAQGLRIFSLYPSYSNFSWERLERPVMVQCKIPHLTLMPGRYYMNISVGSTYDSLIDAITNAAYFDVEPNDYFGTGRLPPREFGVVLTKAQWEFIEGDERPSRNVSDAVNQVP